MNTSSTADISFMLLIFFLVTSSMDTDKGLMRQLPPASVEKLEPMDIKQGHVMTVKLDAADQLTCDGVLVTPGQLTDLVMQKAQSDRLEHVIAIETSRATSYEAYFHVQNAVVRAYTLLRDQRARQLCGHGYATCSSDEREDIDRYYPQRISESAPKEGGES